MPAFARLPGRSQWFGFRVLGLGFHPSRTPQLQVRASSALRHERLERYNGIRECMGGA
jgi:hypothetical protein